MRERFQSVFNRGVRGLPAICTGAGSRAADLGRILIGDVVLNEGLGHRDITEARIKGAIMRNQTALVLFICSFSCISTLGLLAAPGDMSWEATYGCTSPFDRGSANWIEQTSDGGFIVVGFSSGCPHGMYLLKTDFNGNKQWEQSFEGGGSVVHETPDGGYIIGGSSSAYNYKSYMIKTNALGDSVWAKGYADPIHGGSSWLRQTDDGGYILAGATDTHSTGGGRDMYLLKLNASGDSLWSRAYGGEDEDVADSVIQTNDGGYLLGGYTRSFGAGGQDIYVVKTDALGDTLWTRTHGGLSSDGGWGSVSIEQSYDGGYVICSDTYSFGPQEDERSQRPNIYLIKIDSSGITQWSQTYGGYGHEWARSINQTTDGGYFITGCIVPWGSGGQLCYYFIRTGENGCVMWQKLYTHPESSPGYGQQVSDGGYIVAGSYYHPDAERSIFHVTAVLDNWGLGGLASKTEV